MKRRPLLFGLALLLSPVVLLSIIYFDRLEKGYREIFPPDDPFAYRSKSLKCKVTFTNQMFTDPGLFASYHFNPEGVDRASGCMIGNSGLPLLSIANAKPKLPVAHLFYGDIDFPLPEPNQPKFSDNLELPDLNKFLKEPLVKPDPNNQDRQPEPLEIDPTPKDWPSEQPIEIKLNSNLRSTYNDRVVTVKNTGNTPIKLSTKYAFPAMNFAFDEQGRFWHLQEAYTKETHDTIESLRDPRGILPDFVSCLQIVRERRDTIKTIEPNKTLEFTLPQLWCEYERMTRDHRLAQFIVLVGDEDKIIHIFERPCDNDSFKAPRLGGPFP